MIKLIVTDMDGTFLNNRSGFDVELFNQVYHEMQKREIAFAACTGKQCERVEKLFGEHGKDIWILGDSATRIKKDGKVIKEITIDTELAQKSIDQIQQFDPEITIIAATSHGAYVLSTVEGELFEVVKASYEKVIRADSFKEIKSDFNKITTFDPKCRSAALRKHVENTLMGQIYIVDSDPRWVDIAALNTHKGEMVKVLQNMLGVTFDETMSFGDGENDVELMNIGKYSFAMSNACENTKRAASFITRSNEENGVLLTIQKLLDLQEVKR